MKTSQLDHIPDAKPSATVVVLRDHGGQLEVLMLQKNQSINYGGSWVFPGGVCDPADYARSAALLGNQQIENVAKITACREAAEEASLALQPQDLHSFSHWTTPKFKIKRYATWFFLCAGQDLANDVVIDDGEIIQARWFAAHEALQAQAQGEIMLNGPSFVTLSQLQAFKNSEHAITAYQQKAVEHFLPRGHKTKQGIVTVYADDAEYAADKLADELPNRLHRLYMPTTGAWQYHRS